MESELLDLPGKDRRLYLKRMIRQIPIYRRLDLEFAIFKDWYYEKILGFMEFLKRKCNGE